MLNCKRKLELNAPFYPRLVKMSAGPSWKSLEDDLPLPRRRRVGACGYDIQLWEKVFLEPNEIVKVDTRLQLSMPETMFCQLHIRSSMAEKGVILHGGTIGRRRQYEKTVSQTAAHFLIYRCRVRGEHIPDSTERLRQVYAIAKKSIRRSGGHPNLSHCRK